MTLQNVRYELLFESGAVAMLMGFQREAISSIAAALERFYEFAIEVFTHIVGVERGTHEQGWKLLRSQSERQLGAFLLLYLINLRKPRFAGKELSVFEEWAGFRNKIIHQGRFPSRKETLEYAEFVYNLIRDTKYELIEHYPDSVQQVQLRHYARGRSTLEEKAGPPQPDKVPKRRGLTARNDVICFR
ncbi:MAG: hypothetical protein E6J90_50620 [Deltaproteobacteria bacterium]|nr:MAG: hypothetical protein E6J90_50620 [Deltaproteobacteria bacterium]